MNDIFSTLMMFSWILGLFLVLISNPSQTISKVKDFDTNINKPFYGFKYIRKAISLTPDKKIIEKLNRKVLIRKIGFSLLIITPCFLILSALFGR